MFDLASPGVISLYDLESHGTRHRALAHQPSSPPPDTKRAREKARYSTRWRDLHLRLRLHSRTVMSTWCFRPPSIYSIPSRQC